MELTIQELSVLATIVEGMKTSEAVGSGLFELLNEIGEGVTKETTSAVVEFTDSQLELLRTMFSNDAGYSLYQKVLS